MSVEWIQFDYIPEWIPNPDVPRYYFIDYVCRICFHGWRDYGTRLDQNELSGAWKNFETQFTIPSNCVFCDQRLSNLEISVNEQRVLKNAIDALRSQLPGVVVLNHNDRSTVGIPDLSITWNGGTTWVEGKYADPNFSSKGIQVLTMQRLAHSGSAVYLIYQDLGTHKRTIIVDPRMLENWEVAQIVVAPGFNHNLIVHYIRDVHRKWSA